MQDGKWVPVLLSSHHNADDKEEVERINREHPGEEGIIQNGRLLTWLSVTRGQCCEHARMTWMYTDIVRSARRLPNQSSIFYGIARLNVDL